MVFRWGQFHNRYPNYQFLKVAWKFLIYIPPKSDRAHWVVKYVFTEPAMPAKIWHIQHILKPCDVYVSISVITGHILACHLFGAKLLTSTMLLSMGHLGPIFKIQVFSSNKLHLNIVDHFVQAVFLTITAVASDGKVGITTSLDITLTPHGHSTVSDGRQCDCLFNSLSRLTTKKAPTKAPHHGPFVREIY